MKRATAFTVLLLALLTFGCLGCVLTLTDYFAPAFSQSEGSAVLNIETYIDGQNQPTHPAVIDMKREWNGYRYWMSYSPYPNADGAEENPCIGVSNDMIHWPPPEGTKKFTTPAARKDSMGKVTLLEMFTKNWEITPARDTPSALAATIMPMIPA